ncbi:MAG TPA: HAD-IC family P-type ATPase [Solirubrobacteraceae bacterium]
MAVADDLRVLHSLPGRVRIHAPGIAEVGAVSVEDAINRVDGVRRARANALTSNVLVVFDQERLDERRVLARLKSVVRATARRSGERRARRPAGGNSTRAANDVVVGHEAATNPAPRRRARVAVRGLDRDPELARRLVERLSRRPGVLRVSPSPLTGRVLVELTGGARAIQQILDDIADLELPAADDEELPAHPLDPSGIIEGGAKTIGAGLGLALLLGRRMAGSPAPPIPQGAGEVASSVGLIEGVPAATRRIEAMLGHERKELVFGATAIIAMSASGNPFGLAFAGAAALRLLTESLSRRRAWREYELRTREHPAVHPGAVVTLAPGHRAPLPGQVVDGFGVCMGLDGSPQAVYPGARLDPGARIQGAAVTLELGQEQSFAPTSSRPPPGRDPVERYLRSISYGSLAYALATGLLTRSPARILTALLLVNPIPALAGRESADRGASARVIRAGAVVAGTRPRRPISCPDTLLIDEPRTLCDGWELLSARSLGDRWDEQQVLALAAAVSTCAGSPWGIRLPTQRLPSAVDGTFDGRVASAEVVGERWLLGPEDRPGETRFPLQADEQMLMLRRQRDGTAAGAIIVRPHLSGGVKALVDACRTRDVRIELTTQTVTPRVMRLAERAGVPVSGTPARRRVLSLQRSGTRVAIVGDSVRSGAAFDRANLAIALSSGLSGPFPARADLLVPRLEVVASILDAGARRDAAVRDALLLSVSTNVGGATWGLWRRTPFRMGNRPAHIGGLLAMADSTARLWGGRRLRTVTERLSDPLPERWGRESVDDVLRSLHTTLDGLTSSEARERWRARPELAQTEGLTDLLLAQVKTPLVAVLGTGAVLSVAMGALGDVVMIASVVCANAMVGVWQEKRAQTATKALHDLGARTARVLRDGRVQTATQEDLVPGDVIALASGDRVPADARIVSADPFEVDEAALTGESVPVVKSADAPGDANRIVLDGSDVVTGAARAVVVAVGEDTRMGAIAAALAEDSNGNQSPLDDRLGKMLVRGLPWIGLGGLMVTGAGVLRGRSPLSQLALGASVAIAAVPEGLPLLAGVAEAAVAQRLAARNALVSRLSAVEALGRVDVACVDKTGTLTTGTLELTLVADAQSAQAAPDRLSPALVPVLRAAAVASPSPDALDAGSHPTDVAILRGAGLAGVDEGLAEREIESPFDPARSFHATLAGDRTRVKGAVEVLAGRCTRVRSDGADVPLDDAGRAALLERAAGLAGQGLRILLVAEGDVASVEDPQGLTALGFVGISDPLRPGAAAAVRRCREAGVQVVMLTGDHPATAKAIARNAGLPTGDSRMLTGEEVAELDEADLAGRLECATVIARTTPLQKLRIVETLRSAGHVVAMTGDGVNDAPALRLADVGVAMGRGGTEVARQTADLVLSDDEFSTLTEALVEGRGFWHNMRRALGLLLGGNAGEVGLMIASALGGLPTPLTTRQVLMVNLVTDVFPAVSVAIQPPEHRNLALLSREGGSALDAPLRADVIRRGVATALPSFGAYVLATRLVGPAAASSVAYITIVTSQLAQTVDLGQAKGQLHSSVLGAVGGSVAVLAATVVLPPLRTFLGLSSPSIAGLAIAGGASALAVVLGRSVPLGSSVAPA